MAVGNEKYSNGMNLACNRKFPFPDDNLNALHDRIKSEAMQHFDSLPVPIAAYKDELNKVRTKHLQFPLNYWVFINIGSGSKKIGIYLKESGRPISIFQVIIFILSACLHRI